MKRKTKTETAAPLQRWKPEGLRLEQAWVGNGVLAYSAFAINGDAPIGTTWVRLTSNDFGQAVCDILDIYVPGNYRRLGIGTYMMKALLASYGILRTGAGTKDGGMSLMKSLGWKQNKETGDWYLRGTVKQIAKQ